MGRLNRDALINAALDMVDSPSLDAKDRPAGTILSNAMSIRWLQDAYDIFFSYLPVPDSANTVGGTLTQAVLNLQVGVPTYDLPTDFLAAERDGVILTDTSERLVMRDWEEILSQPVNRTNWGRPQMYAILYPRITFRPVPSTALSATFNYYPAPPALTANDVPPWPIDFVLIQYVYMRGLEWLRAVPVGSALEFALNTADRMRRYGFLMKAQPQSVVVNRPGKEEAHEAGPNVPSPGA